MLKTMTRAEAVAAIEDAKRDPLIIAAYTDRNHFVAVGRSAARGCDPTMV